MKTKVSEEEIRVLIIEDNLADVFLLKEALALCSQCQFDEIGDGDQAWRRLAQLKKADRPDVVILDLNLPGRDGIEILSFIRNSPELNDMFVAVVSSFPQDVIRRRTAEANCYMTKAADLTLFMKMAEEVIDVYRRGA